jgi:hypothetical protein
MAFFAKVVAPSPKVTGQKVDKDLGYAFSLAVKGKLTGMEQMMLVIGRKIPLRKIYGNSLTSRRDL